MDTLEGYFKEPREPEVTKMAKPIALPKTNMASKKSMVGRQVSFRDGLLFGGYDSFREGISSSVSMNIASW